MTCCQRALLTNYHMFSPPGVVTHECEEDHHGDAITHTVVQTAVRSRELGGTDFNTAFCEMLGHLKQVVEKGAEDGIIFGGADVRTCSIVNPQTEQEAKFYWVNCFGLKPV